MGTRWTVRVEWDSAAPYTGQATYALTKFTTALEGKSGTWTTSSLPGKASFSLNEYGGTDEIQFTSGWGPENQTNPVIENWAPYSINVTLMDPTGTAITSLGTTPTGVDLTKWSGSEFKIYLNNEASSRIYGTVDLGSSVKVPEIGVRLDGRNLADGISTAKFAKTNEWGHCLRIHKTNRVLNRTVRHAFCRLKAVIQCDKNVTCTIGPDLISCGCGQCRGKDRREKAPQLETAG